MAIFSSPKGSPKRSNGDSRYTLFISVHEAPLEILMSLETPTPVHPALIEPHQDPRSQDPKPKTYTTQP